MFLEARRVDGVESALAHRCMVARREHTWSIATAQVYMKFDGDKGIEVDEAEAPK